MYEPVREPKQYKAKIVKTLAAKSKSKICFLLLKKSTATVANIIQNCKYISYNNHN